MNDRNFDVNFESQTWKTKVMQKRMLEEIAEGFTQTREFLGDDVRRYG